MSLVRNILYHVHSKHCILKDGYLLLFLLHKKYVFLWISFLAYKMTVVFDIEKFMALNGVFCCNGYINASIADLFFLKFTEESLINTII